MYGPTRFKHCIYGSYRVSLAHKRSYFWLHSHTKKSFLVTLAQKSRFWLHSHTKKWFLVTLTHIKLFLVTLTQKSHFWLHSHTKSGFQLHSHTKKFFLVTLTHKNSFLILLRKNDFQSTSKEQAEHVRGGKQWTLTYCSSGDRKAEGGAGPIRPHEQKQAQV